MELSASDKKKYLKTLASEVHRKVIKKFPRRKVVTLYPNETWAADITDMSEFAEDNDDFKYMLTVIDTFSRYAWIVTLTNKDAKTTLDAFKTVVEDAGTTPVNLWVDEGKEFYNKQMKKYCEKHFINMYSTYGYKKNSMIERFNRTIKDKIYKRMVEDWDESWTKTLKELLLKYNNSIHGTTKMRPTTLIAYGDMDEIKKYQQHEEKPDGKKPKFKVGDRVRLALTRDVFSRGFKQKWTNEVYRVKKVSKTYPFTYKVADAEGEDMKGSMYEQDMQKTNLPDKLVIREVLKTREKNGRTEYFVSWYGLPDKFNSWITKGSAANL